MTEPQASRPVPVDQGTTSVNDLEGQSGASVRDPRLGNIYLRPPAPAQRRRLAWPARLMRLEHYPHGLVTEKLRNELTILALMLLAVFIFELAAWSFFFNGLFVGDVDRFQTGGTAAAVLFGLIFAGAILYFERQVITADTWRLKWWRKLLAGSFRVVMILAAGFVVAHAVDLLAFRVPVARSLHARAVDQEEIRLRADLDRLAGSANAERMNALTNELERLRDRIRSAQDSREQAAGDKERYRQQVESLQSEARSRGEAVNQAEAQMVEVEDDLDPTTLRRVQTELRTARSRSEVTASELRAAHGNHSAAQTILQEKDRSIETLLADERRILDERSALSDQREAEEKITNVLEGRLGQWIADLRRSPPGDRTEHWEGLHDAPVEEKLLWPEEWRRELEFDEPETHFFEKLGTVYALLWQPLATGAGSGPPRSRLDPTERPERRLSVLHLTSLVGIHLAAMFVPLLVFAVKWFLMPKEVDAYFSTWHQAFAGDPGARAILSVEDKVRRRNEHW